MASQTETVSGNVTTYVITDMELNTLTVTATANSVTGLTATFVSSANGLHSDGLALLSTLVLLLQTGLHP